MSGEAESCTRTRQDISLIAHHPFAPITNLQPAAIRTSPPAQPTLRSPKVQKTSPVTILHTNCSAQHELLLNTSFCSTRASAQHELLLNTNFCSASSSRAWRSDTLGVLPFKPCVPDFTESDAAQAELLPVVHNPSSLSSIMAFVNKSNTPGPANKEITNGGDLHRSYQGSVEGSWRIMSSIEADLQLASTKQLEAARSFKLQAFKEWAKPTKQPTKPMKKHLTEQPTIKEPSFEGLTNEAFEEANGEVADGGESTTKHMKQIEAAHKADIEASSLQGLTNEAFKWRTCCKSILELSRSNQRSIQMEKLLTEQPTTKQRVKQIEAAHKAAIEASSFQGLTNEALKWRSC
ncbi:unnamed protein product [Closterium sp. Yama58-4]|nr:unnamed protein product [Closterium sp. Yama58-4]